MDKPNTMVNDKKWTPVEALPAGNQLEWPVWRTLNRMRTGVGCTKDNLKKWGLLEGTSSMWNGSDN